jgi:hypothetical protein
LVFLVSLFIKEPENQAAVAIAEPAAALSD